MSSEKFQHLIKSPGQSYLRERYLSTELLRTKKEARTLEQNVGFIAVWTCFGEGIYDTNTDYSPPLENLWTPDTMYSDKSTVGPPVVYDFERFRPNGQCGPSDLVPAQLTEWSEFKESGEIRDVIWQEGALWVIDEGKWVKASDHHTWYEVQAASGESWYLDLAAYQYPFSAAQIRIVMQGLDGHKTDPKIKGINWRNFSSPDDDPIVIPNAHTLHYEPDEKFTIPVSQFNWKNAEGRAEQIMGAKGISSDMTLGDFHNGVHINGGDNYPEGYSFKDEVVGEKRLIKQAASGVSVETALGLVRASSKGEIDLSVESLGVLLKELIEQSTPGQLVTWGIECAERGLDYFEDETGNFKPRAHIAHMKKWLESRKDLPNRWLESLIELENSFGPRFSDINANARDVLGAVTSMGAGVNSFNNRDFGATYISVKSAATSVARALDFSVFDKDVKPFPVSERHWQYLRLYELTHPSLLEED